MTRQGPTVDTTRLLLMIPQLLHLYLKLSSGKFFHFSAIWRAFGALMYLLETKGRGKESCVGLFYCEYSKECTISFLPAISPPPSLSTLISPEITCTETTLVLALLNIFRNANWFLVSPKNITIETKTEALRLNKRVLRHVFKNIFKCNALLSQLQLYEWQYLLMDFC
jgi:hypothetical protein